MRAWQCGGTCGERRNLYAPQVVRQIYCATDSFLPRALVSAAAGVRENFPRALNGLFTTRARLLARLLEML